MMANVAQPEAAVASSRSAQESSRVGQEKQMMDKLLKDKERREKKDSNMITAAKNIGQDLSAYEHMKCWQQPEGWQATYEALLKVNQLKDIGNEREYHDLEGALAMETYGMDMLVWWEVWMELPVQDDRVSISELKLKYADASKRESGSLERMGWDTDTICVGMAAVDAPDGEAVTFAQFWALVATLGSKTGA